MLMPQRSMSSGSYRYGFNSKENDGEVSGSGNQYDYGFRIYNPRLGRFLSTDPLSAKYPWYTPYQFAGNKPIVAVDIDGLEEWMANQHSSLKSKVAFEIQSAKNGQPFIGPATPSKPPVSVQIHKWATGQTKPTNAQKFLATNPVVGGVSIGLKLLYNFVNDSKILFTRDKDGEQTDLIGQRASSTRKDAAFFNVVTTTFGLVVGGATTMASKEAMIFRGTTEGLLAILQYRELE